MEILWHLSILMTCKVLSASGTQIQISSLRGQIDSLRLTARQANERLARSVNPADVSFNVPDDGLPHTVCHIECLCMWHSLVCMVQALYPSFFEGAYDGLINNIKAYLYQAYQVTWSLCYTWVPPQDACCNAVLPSTQVSFALSTQANVNT